MKKTWTKRTWHLLQWSRQKVHIFKSINHISIRILVKCWFRTISVHKPKHKSWSYQSPILEQDLAASLTKLARLKTSFFSRIKYFKNKSLTFSIWQQIRISNILQLKQFLNQMWHRGEPHFCMKNTLMRHRSDQ